jgi:hypothetical protein
MTGIGATLLVFSANFFWEVLRACGLEPLALEASLDAGGAIAIYIHPQSSTLTIDHLATLKTSIVLVQKHAKNHRQRCGRAVIAIGVCVPEGLGNTRPFCHK